MTPWWKIQYSVPGEPWDEMSTPFRSLRAALAWLRHLANCNQIDAYRLVDNEGRQVVAIIPCAEDAL